jgi:hypothetical protein
LCFGSCLSAFFAGLPKHLRASQPRPPFDIDGPCIPTSYAQPEKFF